MTIDKPQPGQLYALRRLWQQAFHDTDGFLDSFFSVGFSPDRCRCISIDGTPAAVLYWFDCQWNARKVAYIYAVATEAAFRGRGLCRTLMEDTHIHLQHMGYAGSVLVPGSQALFSLYEKLGYRAFCPMEPLTAEAGTAPTALRCIPAQEYASLRRAHLCGNSILQEGTTLRFLETFTRFYAGQDFVFCASQEEDTLHFQEYLGCPEAVPRILAALDVKQGILRRPGGNTPFAMYHSLDSSTVLPGYFGLALN